ncbi:hypothetical protein TIFTF001_009864 [Ficus carica]|uniref:Uncharacterized protein n=1 Tax=Ficus carica TaxID=3494 RepID=A0AA88D2Y6_FICCA|nr:hypothetical protein TIFTF001_009864 [Ficus carica]
MLLANNGLLGSSWQLSIGLHKLMMLGLKREDANPLFIGRGLGGKTEVRNLKGFSNLPPTKRRHVAWSCHMSGTFESDASSQIQPDLFRSTPTSISRRCAIRSDGLNHMATDTPGLSRSRVFGRPLLMV